MTADRFVRTFDGPAQVLFYEALATPPSADGSQGDWAMCLGTGTVPSIFGPKTNASTWPSAISLQGTSGASGAPAWTATTAYASGSLVVFNNFIYWCLSAHTSGSAFRPDLAGGKWVVMGNTGRIETVDSLGCGSTTTWSSVNRIGYWRVDRAAGAISQVGLEVAVQSGNIAVAAYADNGSGAPGTLLATSASTACPALSAGAIQNISLGSTVGLAAGDWLALWCDNTTASFRCSTTAAIGGTTWAKRAGFETQSGGPQSTASATVGTPKAVYLVAS